MDTHRTPHPTRAEHTVFSSTHETYDTLDRRTNLSKFKGTEVTQSRFSDHNGIKLELSNRQTAGRSPTFWKLNNVFLSNPWVIQEILREIKKIH